MGRTRPLEIEQVHDPLTGVTATILYDKQRGDYCAELGRDTVRAERASDLVRKLRDELRRGLGLRWERCLVFERALPPRFRSRPVHREGIQLQLAYGFARGEVATTQDGRVLWRGWPPEEIDDDLPDGINPPDNRIVSQLPDSVLCTRYSDVAWRALQLVSLQLARMGEALEHAPDLEAVRRALDLRAFQKEHEPKPPPRD